MQNVWQFTAIPMTYPVHALWLVLKWYPMVRCSNENIILMTYRVTEKFPIQLSLGWRNMKHYRSVLCPLMNDSHIDLAVDCWKLNRVLAESLSARWSDHAADDYNLNVFALCVTFFSVLKRHEQMLSYLACSSVESSMAISHCLYELHKH
jgi:hypothetical protein